MMIKVRVFLIMLLLGVICISIVPKPAEAELYIKGKDNPDNAMKSVYVQVFLEWLRDFAAKKSSVVENGKVKLEYIENREPPSWHLQEKLDNIIENEKTVTLILDHENEDIFVDQFVGRGTQEVDISDIAAFPFPPIPPAKSDSWDKAQLIAHVLNEGFYAALKNSTNYLQCHINGGLSSELTARMEVGGNGERMSNALTGGKAAQLNTTENYITLHWFVLDPSDPSGKRKIENYRENIKLTGNMIVGGNLEPRWNIARDGSGNSIITRQRYPPFLPVRKSFEDPPGLFDNILKFRGRISAVGNSTYFLWSGIIHNFQPVAYEILSIIQGEYAENQIVVNHAIVYGSPDADPVIPMLSPSIFYVGNELIVQAYPNLDFNTDIPVQLAPPVGGIAFPPDKLALLAPYIILAALIAIAAVSFAVYWRRR